MSLSALERRSVLAMAVLFLTRMTGLFMVLPVVAVYAPEWAGYSALLAGLVLGIHGVSQALLQVPFGMLSDRVGRKPVILGGAMLFLLGSVIGWCSEDIRWLLVARLLQGAGAISSVMMALLADLTREEHRGQAMAVVGGSIGVSFAVAMVAGPVVAGWGGLQAVFGVSTALGALAIIIIVRFPEPARQQRHRDQSPVASQLRGIALHKGLMPLNLGVMVLHLIMAACFTVLPTLLSASLFIPREDHGYWYLPVLIGSFLAVVPAIVRAEKKRRMRQAFLAGTLALAVSLIMLIWHEFGRYWTFFALFVYFWAFNLLEASLPSAVSKIAPAGSRGTAMGVYASCQFLGIFLGGAVGGWLMTGVGANHVFSLLAMLAGLWFLVAWCQPEPRHLARHALPISAIAFEAGDYARKLMDIPGVADVEVVLEEKMVYLKVDREVFKDEAARALLA